MTGDSHELPAADVRGGEGGGGCVGGLGSLPDADAGCWRVHQHTDAAHGAAAGDLLPGRLSGLPLLLGVESIALSLFPLSSLGSSTKLVCTSECPL